MVQATGTAEGYKPRGFSIQLERGQAMALFALMLSTLMSFVALAIDGGAAYAQRRQTQNAADTAALSGIYTLLVQKRADTTGQQALLRSAINRAAQTHGVPDTDGIPDNHINANVHAFYSNGAGAIIGDGCEITQCSNTVARQAEGVVIQLRKPFNTFLAGIVGWHRMEVHSQATSTIRQGEPTSGLWAIFASDNLSCGGFVAEATGSSVTVIGNAHSNASFKMSGSNTYVTGSITYKDHCHQCVSGSGTAAIYPVPPIRNLALPAFDDFRTLAQRETELTGSSPGGRINGNLALGSADSGRRIGSEQQPFTFITGNLTVGANASNVTLHGLVFVAGDVKMQGDSTNGSFILVAGGAIDMTGATNFRGVPYKHTTYPLLQDNRVRLLSGLEYSSNGGKNCNAAVIKISGSSNQINGTVLAPRGRIELSGSANEINGALVGDSVSSSGSSNVVRYASQYFPPQADRIELVR
jgi:formylmethanofuran dehydrogenase subunit C